ncbi:MAG: hypothetical protein R3E53_04220 [Myxococcota bacterium]
MARMLDATGTDYFDPDVLALIQGFERETAPARGVKVSLKGFKEHYDHVEDRIQFVDFSTRERQSEITPRQVLDLLIEGNERFRNGVRISRSAPPDEPDGPGPVLRWPRSSRASTVALRSSSSSTSASATSSRCASRATSPAAR